MNDNINDSLRREVRLACNIAMGRVRTWKDHPSYDTKTGVQAELQRALTITMFAARVVGNGDWTEVGVWETFGVNFTNLERTYDIVKTSRGGSINPNIDIPVVVPA
jgi:hypothetical protein